MLEVTFVRKRGKRDRVYVSRGDGSTTGWDFPSYGDGLPHDLCHLVVEDELGLIEGFWGLVDQGVEVDLVDNQATLMRDGEPLTEHPDADFSGLMQAEAAVAALGSPMVAIEMVGELAVASIDPARAASNGPTRDELVERFGADLPESATPEAIASIGERLRDLAARWIALEDSGSITLPFPSA